MAIAADPGGGLGLHKLAARRDWRRHLRELASLVGGEYREM